MLKGLNSW